VAKSVRTDLPVLTFDGKKEPTIAANIYNAQQAGWERILTYDYQKDQVIRNQQRAWKRRGAMNTPGEEVPSIQGKVLHRDEYPFTCTLEHKGSAWIGHAVADENRSQGGQLNAFLEQHGATRGFVNSASGFQFVVEVVNWPPPSKVTGFAR